MAYSDNAEIFGNDGRGEEGDLKALKEARKRQPSAYSSLCDWVAHLAARVGWRVEREMLRLPSTRNLGIVGRGSVGGGMGVQGREMGLEERRERGLEIVRAEGADGRVWVECAKGLGGGKAGH